MRFGWQLVLGTVLLAGCNFLPEVSHQPTVHNPFPQLARVAVAPFFNLSTEPTLDTIQVANAYFNELQLIQGFEVVPVGQVETEIRRQHMTLNCPADARRLAQLLHVDAIVIGAITDYSPYYPPRMGIQVEWYAANPGFHPIPPGYGLPWGTHEEQDIPHPLIFEAEFALARQQLKTQTPGAGLPSGGQAASETKGKKDLSTSPGSGAPGDGNGGPSGNAANGANPAVQEDPAYWPDPRGFVPPPPRGTPPPCWPSDAPVLTHTRTYNGHDVDFTRALENYYVSRDDARLDGWQGYLQRSDDFMRFCCRMHIWEMLTARGGAGETRVVWRWPTIR